MYIGYWQQLLCNTQKRIKIIHLCHLRCIYCYFCFPTEESRHLDLRGFSSCKLISWWTLLTNMTENDSFCDNFTKYSKQNPHVQKRKHLFCQSCSCIDWNMSTPALWPQHLLSGWSRCGCLDGQFDLRLIKWNQNRLLLVNSVTFTFQTFFPPHCTAYY